MTPALWRIFLNIHLKLQPFFSQFSFSLDIHGSLWVHSPTPNQNRGPTVKISNNKKLKSTCRLMLNVIGQSINVNGNVQFSFESFSNHFPTVRRNLSKIIRKSHFQAPLNVDEFKFLQYRFALSKLHIHLMLIKSRTRQIDSISGLISRENLCKKDLFISSWLFILISRSHLKELSQVSTNRN